MEPLTAAAQKELIGYGVLGILFLLAIWATPTIWSSLKALWTRSNTREDSLNSRIEKKDELIVGMVREVASIAAASKEVIAQNSVHIAQGQATHERFGELVDELVTSFKSMQSSHEKRFDELSGDIRQIGQVVQSGTRVACAAARGQLPRGGVASITQGRNVKKQR